MLPDVRGHDKKVAVTSSIPTAHSDRGIAPLETPPRNPWARSIGSLIFVSRWLQAPLYIGLIVAQLVYVVVFMVELYHLIAEDVIGGITHINEATIMLTVLGLIDVVMIANLLIMV